MKAGWRSTSGSDLRATAGSSFGHGQRNLMRSEGLSGIWLAYGITCCPLILEKSKPALNTWLTSRSKLIRS